MELKESAEMYLETILVLSKEKNMVRSIDISEHMHVSKAAVSHAVAKLKESRHILIDSDGYIALTEKGRTIAKKIYERHTIISNILISLGVDEETAAADACRIEHVISDKTFAAIKAYDLDCPKKNPSP